jgi:large subunit ribosomal protein L4
VFAHKPRDFSVKLNKKVKRLALKSVLSDKVQSNRFLVLEDLKLDEIKTKEMKKVLSNFDSKKPLIVIPNSGADADKARVENVILSARNLPNVKTTGIGTINVYDIINCDSMIVTKEAVRLMEEVYA